MKIRKKIVGVVSGGGGGESSGWGCQDGTVRRFEVFVKIQKTIGGRGRVGGVRGGGGGHRWM